MATPTYAALATTTLGSAAASVTFSSIPATYRDLVLVQSSKVTTGSTYSILRINGDTGSNYSMVGMSGNGSVTESASITSSSSFPNYRYVESTSEFMVSVMQFFDYSATDKHKPMLFRTNIAGANVNAVATRWANTNAITSISIATNSSTYTAGSTFSLFGIEA